jgi:hypothetical protein
VLEDYLASYCGTVCRWHVWYVEWYVDRFTQQVQQRPVPLHGELELQRCATMQGLRWKR